MMNTRTSKAQSRKLKVKVAEARSEMGQAIRRFLAHYVKIVKGCHRYSRFTLAS